VECRYTPLRPRCVAHYKSFSAPWPGFNRSVHQSPWKMHRLVSGRITADFQEDADWASLPSAISRRSAVLSHHAIPHLLQPHPPASADAPAPIYVYAKRGRNLSLPILKLCEFPRLDFGQTWGSAQKPGFLTAFASKIRIIVRLLMFRETLLSKKPGF